MNDDKSKRAEHVALFRYGLIADFLHPPAEEADQTLYQRLRHKAAGSYCIPGSRRTRVAVETLKDWLQDYRAGGFHALRPKPRKDIGQARSIPQETLDLLGSTPWPWSSTRPAGSARRPRACRCRCPRCTGCSAGPA